MPKTPKTARRRTKYRPAKPSKATHRTVVFEAKLLDKLRPAAEEAGISINEIVRGIVRKEMFTRGLL